MQISRTEELRDQDVDVFAVDGPFDGFEAQRVGDRIAALAARGERRFIVDLSNVTAMTPAAMAPLVDAARSIDVDDARISVIFDSSLTVFAADGLDALFDVAVTREDALTRIRA